MDPQSHELPDAQRQAPTEAIDPGDDKTILTAGVPDSSLEEETRSLLQVRLRAAAIVLYLAFVLFLTRGFVMAQGVSGALLVSAVFVTWTMVLFWRTRRLLSLRELRLVEILLFGSAALTITVRQCRYGLAAVTPAEVEAALVDVRSCALYWYALIVIYATFIPNTLRRAILSIGLLALVPLELIVILRRNSPALAREIDFDLASDVGLMILVAAATGILGTHLIARLRSEAFTARKFGRYRLLRRIGSGGMGEVYLAEHQLLKRPCAIKVIQPGKHGDPMALARFEREVRATARLSHRNTVKVFDYGRTEDGAFYYVMEFLPGMSLSELIKRHGPMPAGRAVYLLRQTCDALREAHGMGLLHRDIKPGNIFAAQRGGAYDVAKLLDFGLVKPLLDDDARPLTVEGTIAGTPLFMSPEQAIRGAEPDVRSDIYSLGAVAYYLLCGQPPFEGPTPMRVVLAHVREPLVPPSLLRPGIPADLEQVVVRCLAKHPAERFPDVVELERSLAQCDAAGEWTPAKAFAWWERLGDVKLAQPQDQVRL